MFGSLQIDKRPFGIRRLAISFLATASLATASLATSLLATTLFATCDLSFAADDPPLHEQIDKLIEAHASFDPTAASICDDATFFRRAHLDFAGTIPEANSVRKFIADDSDDKRAKAIDSILKSPQYARRMQYVFDVMLMERNPGKHITAPEWQEYLRKSFRQNKSWLQLSKEILSSDGTEEVTRPAAKFLIDREVNVDNVTRDLGRIFLGRDMQCAQCHDHPQVDDYLQRHYYGLAAFIKRSYLHVDPKTKKHYIGEKAEGDVQFTSVFTSETDETLPRMLDSSPLADPTPGDELYKVKPVKNVRSIPIYSRRLQLSSSMTADSNSAFRLNIANRIWAQVMGGGIVEPVDMWHSDNLPSHPELLTLLANTLMEHDYDLRYLYRELALTKTYQRSSQTREVSETTTDDFSVALLKPLSPEQLAMSLLKATGVSDKRLADAVDKEQKAQAKLEAAKQPADAEAPTEKDLPSANGDAVKTSAENTDTGNIDTGNIDAKKSGTEDTEANKIDVNDPEWREIQLHNAVRKDIAIFASQFGLVGVQTSRFDASADQALFLRNGSLLQSWVNSSYGLAAQLQKLETDQVAEELYLSVFSRFPSQSEEEQIRTLLAESKDPKSLIQQLVWASLVSAEFRFNY